MNPKVFKLNTRRNHVLPVSIEELEALYDALLLSGIDPKLVERVSSYLAYYRAYEAAHGPSYEQE